MLIAIPAARLVASLALASLAPLALAMVVPGPAGAATAPPDSIASASVLRLAASTEPGTRLTVRGALVEHGGRPVAGARLHVYQTDASGRYTPERPMDEPHARLAGWLVTAPDGRFELRTIRPGGYPRAMRLGDRERHIPAHVHIDIDAAGHAPRRLQMVFADDPLLADPYWADWVRKLGQPVLTVRPDGRALVGDLRFDVDDHAGR